jgi:hypothetical protein
MCVPDRAVGCNPCWAATSDWITHHNLSSIPNATPGSFNESQTHIRPQIQKSLVALSTD